MQLISFSRSLEYNVGPIPKGNSQEIVRAKESFLQPDIIPPNIPWESIREKSQPFKRGDIYIMNFLLQTSFPVIV
jgi:hypothetical protein